VLIAVTAVQHVPFQDSAFALSGAAPPPNAKAAVVVPVPFIS